MSVLERQIEVLDRLVAYVEGRSSRQAFEDWLTPLTFEVVGNGPPTLDELIREIELHLAEFTSGHLSEQELRSELSPLLQTYHLEGFRIGGEQSTVWQATGTTSVTVGAEPSWSRPGTPRAAAFG